MPNKYSIEDVELTKADLKKLNATFTSEGWPLVCRLCESLIKREVACTVGNLEEKDPIVFYRAQGAMATLERAMGWPDLVQENLLLDSQAETVLCQNQ